MEKFTNIYSEQRPALCRNSIAYFQFHYQATSQSWNSSFIFGVYQGYCCTYFTYSLVFLIFNPQYYPKFFESDNSFQVIGNFSLLAGMASFMILGLYNWCFGNRSKNKEVLINVITSKEILLGLLILQGIYLVFMGYSTWTSASKWQGGLPPKSLVSFIVVLFGFAINGIGRTSSRKSQAFATVGQQDS